MPGDTFANGDVVAVFNLKPAHEMLTDHILNRSAIAGYLHTPLACGFVVKAAHKAIA
jgi:hypothetical protein